MPRTNLHMGSIAFFIGIPEQRELAHCNAGPRDGETVWELRCIPGNLIGVGRSLPDAERSLINLITLTMKDTHQPFDDWYREAWSYADRTDCQKFDDVLLSTARTLQQPRIIENRAGLRLAGCGA